jgi:hypothetical protein
MRFPLCIVVSFAVIALGVGCRADGHSVKPIGAATDLRRLRAVEQELRDRLAAAEAQVDDERVRHEETQSRLHEALARLSKQERAGGRQDERIRFPDFGMRYRVDLGDSHARGPDDAPVTIVEWASFGCRYSKRVQDTLRSLEELYPGKIRIVFKHRPLAGHRNDLRAALAVEAAGRQGKFWEMHDRIWEGGGSPTDGDLRGWAAQIGLDVAQFRRDVNDPRLRDRVRRDETQAERLRSPGTPSFFINGRFRPGARPIERFRAVIEDELEYIEPFVAKSTAPDPIYEVLMRGAVVPQDP